MTQQCKCQQDIAAMISGYRGGFKDNSQESVDGRRMCDVFLRDINERMPCKCEAAELRKRISELERHHGIGSKT